MRSPEATLLCLLLFCQTRSPRTKGHLCGTECPWPCVVASCWDHGGSWFGARGSCGAARRSFIHGDLLHLSCTCCSGLGQDLLLWISPYTPRGSSKVMTEHISGCCLSALKAPFGDGNLSNDRVSGVIQLGPPEVEWGRRGGCFLFPASASAPDEVWEPGSHCQGGTGTCSWCWAAGTDELPPKALEKL